MYNLQSEIQYTKFSREVFMNYVAVIISAVLSQKFNQSLQLYM